MDVWIPDSMVEKWIHENDRTIMPLPAIESEPHLLISKVRKHYMEYLIKLLSVNYENNQKLLNKNIYLPSAIWRCAKIIEMAAAKASMVVHLYRKNITEAIKALQKSTDKGALYRKLYECLHYAPDNEKKVQTTISGSKDCNCQCSCNRRKKVKRNLQSPTDTSKNFSLPNNTLDSTPQLQTDIEQSRSSPKINATFPVDLPASDELTQQLDKLFQGEENDDDLFDNALCMVDNSKLCDESTLPTNNDVQQGASSLHQQDSHNGLDERLAILSGILVNNTEPVNDDTVNNKIIKQKPSKWLCEEHFQKTKLFELLDQIRDVDRNKLTRVKLRLIDLFGCDSDDEGVVSPMEESSDFVISCKERIAPWVVRILTPYYVKGRIRGKNLFKSLAKHLIKLIYQCSKYPHEYEVQSFVKDFLDTHKLIRCEADFKQFRIENYRECYNMSTIL